ncbi:MAG: hypothetical protein ACLFUO_01910 [Candidatus Woesearchaeota archaeon]
MTKIESLEKISKRNLHKELHELLVLKRLVEKAVSANDKAKEIKHIERKLNREEKIEKHFNNSFVKLEEALIDFKGSNPYEYKKMMALLQKADFFRRNLLAILAKGGDLEKQVKELEKTLSDEQFKKVQSEILQTIKMDEGLSVLIGEIIDETKELVKTVPESEHNFIKVPSTKFPSNVSVVNLDNFSDNQSKNYAINVLRQFYAPKLIREIKSGVLNDVDFIKKNGFGIKFTGPRPAVNYALFFDVKRKIAAMPPVIEIRCENFTGQHAEGIKGKEGICVYAGIISNNGDELSSTWVIHVAGNGTPKYEFGLVIKNLFLKKYGLSSGRRSA